MITRVLWLTSSNNIDIPDHRIASAFSKKFDSDGKENLDDIAMMI